MLIVFWHAICKTRVYFRTFYWVLASVMKSISKWKIRIPAIHHLHFSTTLFSKLARKTTLLIRIGIVFFMNNSKITVLNRIIVKSRGFLTKSIVNIWMNNTLLGLRWCSWIFYLVYKRLLVFSICIFNNQVNIFLVSLYLFLILYIIFTNFVYCFELKSFCLLFALWFLVQTVNIWWITDNFILIYVYWFCGHLILLIDDLFWWIALV